MISRSQVQCSNCYATKPGENHNRVRTSSTDFYVWQRGRRRRQCEILVVRTLRAACSPPWPSDSDLQAPLGPGPGWQGKSRVVGHQLVGVCHWAARLPTTRAIRASVTTTALNVLHLVGPPTLQTSPSLQVLFYSPEMLAVSAWLIRVRHFEGPPKICFRRQTKPYFVKR